MQKNDFPKLNAQPDSSAPSSGNLSSPSTKIVDHLKEWAESTTSHGIPKIMKAEHWPLRILWAIFYFASVSYCLYMIIKAFIYFLSLPVTTYVQIVDEIPTAFPAIMICNLNPFNSAHWLFQSNKSFEQTIDNIPKGQTPMDFVLWAQKLYQSLIYNFDEEFKRQVGNELREMLVSCSFGDATCGVDDFEWAYEFEYVNCYRFNANGSRLLGKSGLAYGLRLELYVGNDAANGTEMYTFNRGVRFVVYNHTVDDPFIAEQGADAAPGLVTNVDISKNMFVKLGHPYSTCVPNQLDANTFPHSSPFIDIMREHLNQTRYSQIYCQNLCLQEAIKRACACFAYGLPFYNTSGLACCEAQSQLECTLTVEKTFLADPNPFCHGYCPRECELVTYDMSISSSQYLTKWYWERLRSRFANYTGSDRRMGELYGKLASFGLSEARSNMLMVNFYFTNMEYKFTTESAFYTFNALLSDIGGQMGLFVGMSLLSLVEVLEFIVQMLIVWAHSLKSTPKISMMK